MTAVLALLVANGLALVVVATAHSGHRDEGVDRGSGTASFLQVDGVRMLEARLVTLDDHTTRLADEAGDKPLLVSIWSATCSSCVPELPILEHLHHTDERVEVVGVDTMDRLPAAKRLATANRITFDWFQDRSGQFAQEASTTFIPWTVLLTPDGHVLASRPGRFHSTSELRAWLDAHLP